MSRFSVDISNIPATRPVIPAGEYPARIVKGEFKTGEKDGKHWGRMNFTLAINDEEVAKAVGQDEPKVFYQFMMNFNEDGVFLKDNNDRLGGLQKVTGLTDVAKEDFEDDVTEEATTQWEYNARFFDNMAKGFQGYDLLAKVVTKPSYSDPDVMVNEVSKIAVLSDDE